MSLDLFAVLFGGATALLPIFAAEVLRIGPMGLGVLRTAPGVGAAITAGVLTLRPINRHAGAVYVWRSRAVRCSARSIFGAVAQPAAVGGGAVACSAAATCSASTCAACWCSSTRPIAIRGRVSAINSMFIGGSNELGEFESGVTARWFGAVRATLLGGVLTLVVVGCWMGLFPSLRRLDHLR